jgi:beta-glucosidase
LTRLVHAFDAAAIHAGNRALDFEHDAIAAAARALVERMTLDQLVNEIRGRAATPAEGLYYAGGDPELELGPWKMVDGPRGARTGRATAFPVAIARAATFDVDLEKRIGIAIGREVAARGGNVVLAPTVNLLRHPGWGRAQETYSEDPWLTGALGCAFVSGAQQFVVASPKHLALNNLENTRFDMSADVDPRTLHELYLPHFRRCLIEAAAGSVMTAYNRINGTYCGEHAELITDILRARWGYRGFVESDWFLGTRSTAPALRAGLDIEMPAPYRFSEQNIAGALESGALDLETIRSAAEHSIHQKLAWGVRAEAPEPPAPSVVECPEHLALAREAAERSIVLLKNERATLPLGRALRLAVVGTLARVANLGDRGSSMVTPTRIVTPLEGVRAALAAGSVDHFDDNVEAPLEDYDVALVVTGLTWRDEGEFIPTAQQEAEAGELARGGDRDDLRLPAAAVALIERCAGRAGRTIVALQGGSAITVREWIDRVDALLMTWYPGCEGGSGLARVLFGDVCPSGRLPVAVPRHLADLPPWDTRALNVRHDLLHGYRWLDHQGLASEFPFGYGLSYTTFELSNHELERRPDGFEVRVDVCNTGPVDGAAVVQLYVVCLESKVFRAPRELKGFARVPLLRDETATVQFDVTEQDLAWFDAAARGLVFEACTYRFELGWSAADLPLAVEWRAGGGR